MTVNTSTRVSAHSPAAGSAHIFAPGAADLHPAASSAAASRFIRRVMAFDAASCLACAVPQLLFSGFMSRLLGFSADLLVGTGLFLLAYAALLVIMATRSAVPRAFVWLLVVGNVGWAVGCAVALELSPTTAWGSAYAVMQAITVLVFAALQRSWLKSTT